MVQATGENLVFILSLPRSGSTLLSLILGGHSQLLSPPETWLLLKLAQMRETNSWGGVFDNLVASKALSELLDESSFTEASRAFALSVFNDCLRQVGKAIFVEKTPRYYHILDYIDALFPEAKKLWLRRNPLDVSLSYKSTWNLSISNLCGRRIGFYSYDFAKGLFDLDAYFTDASPNRMVLDYEQLVINPQARIGEVCDFIQVPFEEEMLEYSTTSQLIMTHTQSSVGDKKILSTRDIHSNSTDLWEGGLSKRELQQVINLLGKDIFLKMGYEQTVTRLFEIGISFPSEEAARIKRRHILDKADSDPASLVQHQLFLWRLHAGNQTLTDSIKIGPKMTFITAAKKIGIYDVLRKQYRKILKAVA